MPAPSPVRGRSSRGEVVQLVRLETRDERYALSGGGNEPTVVLEAGWWASTYRSAAITWPPGCSPKIREWHPLAEILLG